MDADVTTEMSLEMGPMKQLKIGKVTRTTDGRGLNIVPTKEVEVRIIGMNGDEAFFSGTPDMARSWAEALLRFAREQETTEHRANG